MEERAAKLEATAEKTADRLTAIETRLTKIETRMDAMAGRDELHKALNEQTWRIVGAMITFGGLLSAAVFFIARNVR
jgi:hypothetical protein